MIRSAFQRAVAFFLALVAMACEPALAQQAAAEGSSPLQIKSLLQSRCGKCHDEASAKGGLSLVSAMGLRSGGESGPAVVPGKPLESLLIAAVGYGDEQVKMPPESKLTAAEIASLVAWVEAGAIWPAENASDPPTSAAAVRRVITAEDRAHWAFQPLHDAVSPAIGLSSWPRGPIDRFILARLEGAGLAPAEPAEKRTLLRRATFDLTGLPPTPEETRDFLADQSPEAFEKVVERLLASPRYGERWGRHGLDVVRYADARDLLQLPPESDFREAWRYRDWVIDALNRDIPYTTFLSQQIAGDLLQPDDPARIDADALVATGFLAIADFVPGDVDKDRMIADLVNDQIDVFSRTFLGLSIACARCHDHKFDPISTDDYHALAGIFFSTHLLPGPVKGNTPLLRVPLLPAADVQAIEEQSLRDKKRVGELAGEMSTARDREHGACLETIVVADAARYALAAWDLCHPFPASPPVTLAALAATRQLDEACLSRWQTFLAAPPEGLVPLASAADRPQAIGLVADMGAALAASAARRMARRTDPAFPLSTAAEVFRFQADDHSIVTDPAGRITVWPDQDGLADDALPVATNPAPSLCQSDLGGRERSVVRFDGDSWLEAAHEVPPVGTLIAFFRPAGDALPGQRLLGWEDAAAGQHGVGLIADASGSLHAILRRGGANGDIVATASEDPAGFQLVTLSWGPAGTELFRNGAAAGAKTTLDSVSSAADIRALRIGGAGSGAGPSFRGDLAELRVYAGQLDDRARGLVEAEVRARWLEDNPGPEASADDILFDALIGSRGPFWRAAADRDAWLDDQARRRIDALHGELASLKQKPPLEIPRAVVVQEGGVPGTRHEGFQDAAVFIRGNPANPGRVVPRGFPHVLAGDAQPPIAAGSGRRELAAWLASPSHPLTARVMVNRIWQHHFGAGLVPVESGFGLRGERPLHPHLLDHLAARFVESGWSVKTMHRMMMLSSTYQQGSWADAATIVADPENRLLSRMPRQRLEAEAIRDALLAVSGRLDMAAGGPAFSDLATPRRSVYLMTARTGAKTAGFGLLFDAADCGAIVEARKESIVAPQALFLLNDPFVLDLADALAARLTATMPEEGSSARIGWLHELLFGRPPTTDDLAIAEKLLADSGDEEGWSRLCHVLLCTNEFIHVD